MSKYRFTKDSSLQRPRNISKEDYISASYGDIFYYEPVDKPLRIYHLSGNADYSTITSLKNTINYYSGQDDIFKYENFYNKQCCLLSFSSHHLGTGIEKGSVKLTYYRTGSVLAQCTDKLENGVLYDLNNEKIGIVLYDEGFILLNNTSSLTADTHSLLLSDGTNVIDNIKWVYYLSEIPQYLNTTIEYLATNNVSTNTYFVYANKNELNHSNNITYIESGSYFCKYDENRTNYFVENTETKVKKVNKSPFVSGSSNFNKETYISTIGLYDKDKNLIGVANLANPVRKTENREYLFKLKLDLG